MHQLFNQTVSDPYRDNAIFLSSPLTDKDRCGVVLGTVGAERLTRLRLLYVILAGGDVVEVTHRSERICSAS